MGIDEVTRQFHRLAWLLCWNGLLMNPGKTVPNAGQITFKKKHHIISPHMWKIKFVDKENFTIFLVLAEFECLVVELRSLCFHIFAISSPISEGVKRKLSDYL